MEENTVQENITKQPVKSSKTATKKQKKTSYSILTAEEKKAAKEKKASYSKKNEDGTKVEKPKKKRSTKAATKDTKAKTTKKKKKDSVVIKDAELKSSETTVLSEDKEIIEEPKKEDSLSIEEESINKIEETSKEDLEARLTKKEDVSTSTNDDEELDLKSIPSIVEKPTKVDKLSNTIQLRTSDDTLVLQKELDYELLKKHFNVHILEVLKNPYEIVERIDFYDFKQLWIPIVKLAIKWGIIVIPYIYYLANHVNQEAFSYARMLFTDMAWGWLRLVFFGVLTETLIYLLESFVGLLFGKGFQFKKILTAESFVSPSIVIPYLIAGLLLVFNQPLLGWITFIIALVYSCNLHTHVHMITSGFSKYGSIVITSIGFGLAAFLLGYWFKTSGEDILQILRVFLN